MDRIENLDHKDFSLRKETMYPKKDYFSFISIETTHISMVSWRKNNTAAHDVANLLIFYCILPSNKKTTFCKYYFIKKFR